MLIPAIINSVLAIELYLKSHNAYSVIETLEDYGDGVCGGRVTVKPDAPRHKLTEIFDVIDVRRQNRSRVRTKSQLFSKLELLSEIYLTPTMMSLLRCVMYTRTVLHFGE